MRSLAALLLVALLATLALGLVPSAGDQLPIPMPPRVGWQVHHVEFVKKEDCDEMRKHLRKHHPKGAHVFSHHEQFFDVFLSGTVSANGSLTLDRDGAAALRAIQNKKMGYYWSDWASDVEAPRPIPGAAGKGKRGDPEAIIRGGARGRTGKGVILAVLDTGIDFHNADFIVEENGKQRSRLLYYWDTLAPADETKKDQPPVTLPNKKPLGRLYTRDELTAELTATKRTFGHSVDAYGHGTACMAIAAGNGRGWAKPDQYKGVAPEAELVAVRLGLVNMTNSYLLNAICGWLHQLGEARKMPVVISCSYGGHFGGSFYWMQGYNGQQIEQRQLNARFKEGAKGRALCLSGGNDGFQPIHTQLKLKANGETKLKWKCADPKSTIVLLYFRTGDSKAIQFRGKNAKDLQEKLKLHEPSNEVWFGHTFPKGGGEVTLTTTGNAEVVVDAYVLGWARDAKGNSTGWLVSEVVEPKPLFAHLCKTPASVPNAITVGSYDFNPTDQDNKPKDVRFTRDRTGPMAQLGALSAYSSPGPSRAPGVTKPDLVAPGQWWVVREPKGSLINGVGPGRWQGGAYATNGTSSATPYVAGVVALMLEKNRELSVKEIKTWLTSKAVKQQVADQKNYWGHGKLTAKSIEDLLDALNAQLKRK